MNRTLNILKCLLLMVVVGALIVPGAVAVSPFNDTLTNYGAGQVSQHKISFNLTANLPAGGTINIGFDPGFNISAFTNDTVVNGIDGTYTWSKEPNTIVIRRTSGASTPALTVIEFTLGNITNPSTIGSKSIEVATRTGLGTIIELFTTTVPITAGPAAQFTLNQINNQVAGTSFTVTVTAKDEFGNIDTTFINNTAILTSTIGSIEPHIMNGWSNGVWTNDSEVIKKTGTGTITATSGSITKTSNQFTVNPGVVDSIVIDNIASPKYDELPFTVTARAYDRNKNLNTTYDGTVTILALQSGDIRPITASNLTPQKFVAGVLSVTVKVDVTDTAVPQPTYYGVGLKIQNPIRVFNTSNLFNVSELPVDLVNSTVVAYPPVVPEDGTSTSTITVTVKNSITYEVIPGVTVSVASDRGDVDAIAPATNNTDSTGMARFTIRSSTKGTANITATVKSTKVIIQKATVYFGYDNMLHLSKDWNLVSVPRQLANSALSALGTTKVDRIYYYDAGNKNWTYALYNRTSGTWSGTLTAIDDGKGYWMFASEVANVPITIKTLDPLQTPPEYALKAGWNLIGYTSLNLKPSMWLYSYLSPLTNPVSGERIWDSAYEWTGSGFNSWYYDDFETVSITRGYWVHLNSDGKLVPLS